MSSVKQGFISLTLITSLLFFNTSSVKVSGQDQSWEQHERMPKTPGFLSLAAWRGRFCRKGDISTASGLLMSMPRPSRLSSNEAAPEQLANMQYFGNKCFIIRNTVNGYELYAIDFKDMNEAIKHLLERNHEVVKMEFQRKNELSKLVMEYITYCASLVECLKKAKEIQLAIKTALDGQSEHEEWERCLSWLLEKIENFKKNFQTHLVTQEERSKKLQTLNARVNKRLKFVKRWKKAYTNTFAAVSMVVPFMGVALVIVAPPLATAIEQANTILLGFLGRWIDSFWKNKEKKLKRKEKVIRSIKLKDSKVDLYAILDRIDKIGIEFESLFQNSDLGEEDIMVKKGNLLKTIEDLCKEADMCSSNTRNARKGVLSSIIEDPASN